MTAILRQVRLCFIVIFDKIVLIMEILIIIVLVLGGWLYYNSVDKLNKYVAWLNKEIQEIQTKVREIDGMMKKLSQKDVKQK